MPILMKSMFELACSYSGQILSYTKMLGQLQDAGNTTTLAHYLNLFFIMMGFSVFSGAITLKEKANSVNGEIGCTAEYRDR